MMARTLRAEPSALRIAIRFLADAPAPGHQADAVDRHPHEQALVSVSCRSGEPLDVPRQKERKITNNEAGYLNKKISQTLIWTFAITCKIEYRK